MRNKLLYVSLVLFSFLTANQALFAQNPQEIVLTIEGLSVDEKLNHFNNGEALRGQMKFMDAIAEYEKVIISGETCGKESEAHYNIGLCYTWLGKLDSAAAIFEDVIRIYPGDGLAVGYAQYGLAWVDVQKENYENAIVRLKNTLNSQVCKDIELNAMMQFAIGRIYGAYLRDWQKAGEFFKLVLEKYPNTKVANHPYVKQLKD